MFFGGHWKIFVKNSYLCRVNIAYVVNIAYIAHNVKVAYVVNIAYVAYNVNIAYIVNVVNEADRNQKNLF